MYLLPGNQLQAGMMPHWSERSLRLTSGSTGGKCTHKESAAMRSAIQPFRYQTHTHRFFVCDRVRPQPYWLKARAEGSKRC
jgi:hypothetical protein